MLDALGGLRERGRRSTARRSACRCRASTSSPSTTTTAGSWRAPSTAAGSRWVTRSCSIRRARGAACKHRGLQPAAAHRGDGGRGDRLHADGADLCRARRDRGDGRPAKAAGHDPTEGQRVLARQESLGHAKRVYAQAGRGAGPVPRRADSSCDRRLGYLAATTRTDASSGTRSPSARSPSAGRSRSTRRQCPTTGRFVIVDNFEISGGGIVREALPDNQAWIRDKVLERNGKWEAAASPQSAASNGTARSRSCWSSPGTRTPIARRWRARSKARLFDEGRHVYFLGIGNVLYGVDADIDRTGGNRLEHLRRLGEVANILLDAGLIVIATAAALTKEDVDVIRTSGGSDRVLTVWLGRSIDDGSRLRSAPDASSDAETEGVSRVEALATRLRRGIQAMVRRISTLDPAVLWFTGCREPASPRLPGRSTERLLAVGVRVEYLDGDAIREHLPEHGVYARRNATRMSGASAFSPAGSSTTASSSCAR